MKRTLLWMAGLALMLGTLGSSLQAQDKDTKDITGNWQGTLQVGQGARTLIKISNDDGKLKAMMYNVDQGAAPLPITSISLQGQTVTFTIKQIEVTYSGTLSADGKSITGNATFGGQTHVWNLDHVTAEAAWPIPEPPKAMDPNAKPKFDVVTVKPSDPNRPGKLFTVRGRHVMTINTTLNDLITFAYGLHAKQIINAPDWFGTDKFDIDGVPDIEGQPNSKQMKLLIQSALTDRFKLTFHHEQKELSVYAITVGKSGPKMTETTHQPNDPVNFLFRGKLGDLFVTNATMKDFCDGMQSAVTDKPVVDHTGLTARYDFNLKWTPDESQFAVFGGYKAPATEDPNAPPSLSTALQEQLGLKIDAVKAPAEVFVIDHIEKPSAN